MCSVDVPWSYCLAGHLVVLILIKGTLVELCDRCMHVIALSVVCKCYYKCVRSEGCMFLLKCVSCLFLLSMFILYSSDVNALSMPVLFTLLGSSDFKEKNFNYHITYSDYSRKAVLFGQIIVFLPHENG